MFKSRRSKKESKASADPELDVTSTVSAPLPTMDETEQILLQLHNNLIDFYAKHKPENVDEDVLTILMQFFIDAGAEKLNKKLMDKYGEDLNTFVPVIEQPDDQQKENKDKHKTLSTEYQATLQRVKRTSLSDNLDKELGIQTPMKKVEVENTPTAPIKPRSSKRMSKKQGKKQKSKGQDPELVKYMDEQTKKSSSNLSSSERLLKETTNNPTLKLELLDKPDSVQLTARDLIEAFYSKHDESKLDNDSGIQKFVQWVDQHSLEALSEKLKTKYKEGLLEPSLTQLARRRRNLEDLLTAFYLEHDKAKLDTRWTTLKIVNWTMSKGVPELNKKFKSRYSHDVVVA